MELWDDQEMEFLADVIVWMLIAGVIGGAALFMWLKQSADKDRAERERAPEILDEMFDGTPQVVYRTGVVAIPPTEVVAGAAERGYRLDQDVSDLSGRLMTFLKIA